MAEYIEREALINSLPPKCNGNDMYARAYNTCYESIVNLINAISAADVVEVVRCKNCVNRVPIDERLYSHKGKPAMYCFVHSRLCGENEYCSYGEKMDGKGEGE